VPLLYDSHFVHEGVVYFRFTDEETGAAVRASRSPIESLGDLPGDLPQAAIDAVASLWTPAFVDDWVATHRPAPTLAQLKAQARIDLPRIRWEHHKQVVFNGVVFASDDTAATRLMTRIKVREMAQAMGLEAPDATRAWQALDKTVSVQQTLNQDRALLMAGVAQTQAAFDYEAVLGAQADAADTITAFSAVDLNAGWP
jgi:hypothetical protein